MPAITRPACSLLRSEERERKKSDEETQRHITVMLLVAALLAPLLLISCGKSVGDTIDDATITTRVKTSLLNDPVTSEDCGSTSIRSKES